MTEESAHRKLERELERSNAYARKAEDAAARNLRTAILRQEEIEATAQVVRRARGNRGWTRANAERVRATDGRAAKAKAMAAKGLSNWEIARQLGKSERTIERYLQRLMS